LTTTGVTHLWHLLPHFSERRYSAGINVLIIQTFTLALCFVLFASERLDFAALHGFISANDTL